MGVTARRRRPPVHRHDDDCGHRHDGAPGDVLVRVADLVRERFRLGAVLPIGVEERPTTEPGFPSVETRIVFWSGNAAQHQHRIFKPAAEVTILDLPPWWYKDALILDEFPYCDCCG